MPGDLTYDKSTLVQVMAWCRQATSHYLSQCWPRSSRHMASPGHNELILLSHGLCMQVFQQNRQVHTKCRYLNSGFSLHTPTPLLLSRLQIWRNMALNLGASLGGTRVRKWERISSVLAWPSTLHPNATWLRMSVNNSRFSSEGLPAGPSLVSSVSRSPRLAQLRVLIFSSSCDDVIVTGAALLPAVVTLPAKAPSNILVAGASSAGWKDKEVTLIR